MKFVPHGRNAVMSSRVEALDSLDFFPTPPYATRALCEHVLFNFSKHSIPYAHYQPHLIEGSDISQAMSINLGKQVAWEPAAGEGHMVEPLKEYFGQVHASDIHDYGKGYGVGAFVGLGAGRIGQPNPDWIITNPPFRLAKEFAARAIDEAKIGVALLLRSVFIESEDRYNFFQQYPLTLIAPFAERVAMTKGVWDPRASTATSYAWFVWFKPHVPRWPRVVLIPPGRKRALTMPDDVRRFGPPPEVVLPADAEHDNLLTAVASLEA